MKFFIRFLKVIMVPLVAIYPLYINILGGVSYIINGRKFLADEAISNSVLITMYTLAGIMFVSSVLFSAAMVFALCKLNKIAVALDIIAIVMCVADTFFMDSIIMAYELRLINVKPLSGNLLLNHLPTIAPFLAILIVSLVQNMTKDTAFGPVWDNFKENNDENRKIIREGKQVIKNIKAGKKDFTYVEPEEENDSKKGKNKKAASKKSDKSKKKKK